MKKHNRETDSKDGRHVPSTASESRPDVLRNKILSEMVILDKEYLCSECKTVVAIGYSGLNALKQFSLICFNCLKELNARYDSWSNVAKKEAYAKVFKELDIFIGQVVKGNLPKQRIRDFQEGYDCAEKNYNNHVLKLKNKFMGETLK